MGFLKNGNWQEWRGHLGLAAEVHGFSDHLELM